MEKKQTNKQTKTITLYLLLNYIWHVWAINQWERQGYITYFKDRDNEVSKILIYYISELNRASEKKAFKFSEPYKRVAEGYNINDYMTVIIITRNNIGHELNIDLCHLHNIS